MPVSTDELLKELQHTLNAINPHAVGNLVTNLATDLDGQGANLNKLIASAAGTVQLLANKGNDLGQLNGTLAQLTGTLDTDTTQIEQLVEQYDTVSTTVAQHSGQLNDAITQLAGASSGLVSLLVPNLQPLEADVGTVTTVGRTLDRNLSSVDEILQNGNNLFQGAKRAYDPTYDWLDLNLATAPGVTGAYIAGLLRDRLAGICRRIVANHSSGLSAAVLATLNQCGNPSSGFFDPLLNDIPTILNTLEREQQLGHRAVAAAAGPHPDRQRRAGRRRPRRPRRRRRPPRRHRHRPRRRPRPRSRSRRRPRRRPAASSVPSLAALVTRARVPVRAHRTIRDPRARASAGCSRTRSESDSSPSTGDRRCRRAVGRNNTVAGRPSPRPPPTCCRRCRSSGTVLAPLTRTGDSCRAGCTTSWGGSDAPGPAAGLPSHLFWPRSSSD